MPLGSDRPLTVISLTPVFAAIDAPAVAAIGSHGQTVWHDPDREPPETLQLGDPRHIANGTGITTIGDFRRADIEAGGQGAPLAPLLHRVLFARPGATRVVLNLGGIANVSVLHGDGQVTGFDTGPANCLMDAWIQRQRNAAFDRDGAWAASAQPEQALLERLDDIGIGDELGDRREIVERELEACLQGEVA